MDYDFYMCREDYDLLTGVYGQIMRSDPYLAEPPCENTEEIAALVDAAASEIERTWGDNAIPVAAHAFLHRARVWGWID